MRTIDTEVIRGAGRGEERQAVKIFKLKIAGESTYQVVLEE